MLDGYKYFKYKSACQDYVDLSIPSLFFLDRHSLLIYVKTKIFVNSCSLLGFAGDDNSSKDKEGVMIFKPIFLH